MLNRMRMAQKLWLAVVFIVVAMVAVVGFSGYRSAKVQAASEALQKDMEARTGAAMRWMALTETNAVRTLAVILSSDPSVEEEFKDPMAATSAQISEVQKSLESMALREADKAQMGRIAEARSAMLALRGEARKIRSGRNLGTYDVRITDSDGTLVAIATVTGFMTKYPIQPKDA